MKSAIFIFFFWVFCSNIVASSHQYPSNYHKEVYQQHPDWSTNQHYLQNPNPAYPISLPAINYGQPQHVVNHAHSLPEQEQATNFHERQQEPVHVQHQQLEALQQQHLEHLVESAAKSQSEDIVQQPPAHVIDINYGVGNQPPWQQAPSNSDGFLPQDPRQWSLHNPYPPVLNVHQEPHLQPAYPHWLASSYQNVPQPNSYYGYPYDGQTTYNTQYPTVQVPPQASAHATSAVSAKNFREILASKPEVKDYLESANEKKRFLLIHPNGTMENVDVVEDSLLGNSQHYKSSDILTETVSQEKVANKYNKQQTTRNNHKYDKIASTTPVPDNDNINAYEHYQNNDKEFVNTPRPNVQKETQPGIKSPVSEDHTKKYYHPRFWPIQTNKGSYTEGSTTPPAAKAEPYNNYRHIPALKNDIQNYENPAYEKNITPSPSSPVWNNDNNYRNPSELPKSKTDFIDKVKETKDKKYDTISTFNEENNKKQHQEKHSYASKTNSENSSVTSSTKFVESNNYNQKPTFDSSQTNEQNNYYTRGHRNSETSSRVHNNNEVGRIPAEYTLTTQASDDSNVLDEGTTTSPYYFQKHSKKSYEINTEGPTVKPPKRNDYGFYNNYQNQNSAQESIDDTSSNVQSYSGVTNPTTSRNNNGKVTTDSYVSSQQDDSNSESCDSDEDSNDDTTNEKKTSDKIKQKETEQENVDENEDNEVQQSKVESSYSDSYYSSSTTANYVTMSCEDSVSASDEDCSTEITTKSADNEKAEEPQNTTSKETKAMDKLDENEDEYDFANLTYVSITMSRLDEDFWDNFFENDFAGICVCNVKMVYGVTKRTSNSYVLPNGTFVEEIEETMWEDKEDSLPREIRRTKIIRNPAENQNPDKTEGAFAQNCEC